MCAALHAINKMLPLLLELRPFFSPQQPCLLKVGGTRFRNYYHLSARQQNFFSGGVPVLFIEVHDGAIFFEATRQRDATYEFIEQFPQAKITLFIF